MLCPQRQQNVSFWQRSGGVFSTGAILSVSSAPVFVFVVCTYINIMNRNIKDLRKKKTKTVTRESRIIVAFASGSAGGKVSRLCVCRAFDPCPRAPDRLLKYCCDQCISSFIIWIVSLPKQSPRILNYSFFFWLVFPSYRFRRMRIF